MTTIRPLIADIDAEIREFPLVAGDGLRLGLTRFRRGHGERSVVLIHGLTASTDMFVVPEIDNLVESLLDPFRSAARVERLAERTGAQVLAMPDSGHFWMLDEPQAAAAGIRSFWAGLA